MKRMTRALSALLFLAALAAADASAFQRLAVGDVLEDFSLNTLSGGVSSLNGSKGAGATVVVFWASWSPRSAEILTDLQALYAQYRVEGLGVVGVNVEHPEWVPGEFPQIKEAADTAGVGFPMLLDRDYTLFQKLGIVAVPSSLVLDASGKITLLVSSYSTEAKTDLKEEVLRLLGKKAPPSLAVQDEMPKPRAVALRYLNLGRLLMDRKQFSRAIDPLKRALVEDPTFADALRMLAEAYGKMGLPEEAAAAERQLKDLEKGGAAAPPHSRKNDGTRLEVPPGDVRYSAR